MCAIFLLSLSLTLSPSLVCRVGSEGGFNQSRPVWVSNWAIFPHKKNGCLRKRSDTSLTVTCASLWHVLSTGSDVFESCVYIYMYVSITSSNARRMVQGSSRFVAWLSGMALANFGEQRAQQCHKPKNKRFLS